MRALGDSEGWRGGGATAAGAAGVEADGTERGPLMHVRLREHGTLTLTLTLNLTLTLTREHTDDDQPESRVARRRDESARDVSPAAKVGGWG